MVNIPSGSFVMGAAKDEVGSFLEEGPQRTLVIRPFAISKFDVTRGQWAAFVAATNRPTQSGCEYSLLSKEEEATASWKHLGFPQDDSHPVVCVSYADAQDYARWLSQKGAHTYRLLSEAEWEYAARAGATTPYPWGTKASHEFTNYGGEDHPGYGVAKGRDRWEATSPVGSFPPNAFGLYDMHGNVMQWVRDCFASSYRGLPIDGTAYTTDVPLVGLTGDLADMNGTHTCSYRVLRGGDWGDPPGMIRSASRNFAPPPGQRLDTYRSSGLGIRVASDGQKQPKAEPGKYR
jgi:formylglycine-generating enzyme required for sulfatase activity